METHTEKGIITYGYWYSDSQTMYPKPEVGTVKDIELINKLELIINRIERTKISLHDRDYLEYPIGKLDGRPVLGGGVIYMGHSCCNICGIENGCIEYVLKSDTVEIHIPEGLLHYLKDHNIEHSMESIVSKIDLDIELESDIDLDNMKTYLLQNDMYFNSMKINK